MGEATAKTIATEFEHPLKTENRLQAFLPAASLFQPERSIALAEVAPDLAADDQRREEKERARAEKTQRRTLVRGD